MLITKYLRRAKQHCPTETILIKRCFNENINPCFISHLAGIHGSVRRSDYPGRLFSIYCFQVIFNPLKLK